MNLEKIVEFAKHRREELAADALGPDDDVFPPIIVFARGGKTIATVFLEHTSQDETMEAMTVGVRGYSADELVFIVDGHALYSVNGETLDIEDIEHGDLQKECIENSGRHRPGVSCVMVVTHAKKDGYFDSTPYPYQMDYDVGEITWHPELMAKQVARAHQEQTIHQGTIPDTLRRVFSMTRLEDKLTEIDDPVGQMIYRLVKEFAGPDGDRRVYVDKAISMVLEHEGKCNVVTTPGDKDPL